MRCVNTLSTVGTTTLALGEAEFLTSGQRCIVGAVDSVATATMRVTYKGVETFTGPLPIEQTTDGFQWPNNIATSFIARADGQMIAVLGGTVAGCRANFLILSPDESVPW